MDIDGDYMKYINLMLKKLNFMRRAPLSERVLKEASNLQIHLDSLMIMSICYQ